MYDRLRRYRLLILILAVFSVVFFWMLRRCESSKEFGSQPKPIENAEELGRQLFFDQRLSVDNSVACVSCHLPEKAFTDGQVRSIGVKGRIAFRNAPTLLNVKDAKSFMFDAHITSLEEQALVPIQDTAEMNNRMGELLKKLNKVPRYHEAAKRLFNREFDAYVLTRSLAAFERTLISDNSRFDRWKGGEEASLTADEQKGWQLFNDLQCIECHSLPHFSDYQAHNNGLYIDDPNDPGKFRINGDSSLMGAFKVPSLRNIELTAPYMHDGSMTSLDAVFDHYFSGGNGHWNTDPRIRKREVTEEERNFLRSFLHSLTDTTYLVNYR